MCHGVSLSIPFCLNIFTYTYWNESLIWFEASGFCSTVNTGSRDSVGCFVVLCHGDPSALVLQDQLLHSLWQFIDRVDIGIGELKALALAPRW